MSNAIRLAIALLIAGAACSGPQSDEPSNTVRDADAAASAGEETKQDRNAKRDRNAKAGGGAFTITLGEWAVTPEADAVRPGPVNFEIVNRGSMTHGFEIESDFDHSGSGGGDGYKFETNLIEPGESVTVRLDLAPGTYKIECLVDGHDDRGMEGFLHVRRGAGTGAEEKVARSDNNIAIEGFAFEPASIEVSSGTELTWTNADPTEHTVTGQGFGSDTLAAGDRFSHRFGRPGTYRYRCAIHPEMTARVTVTG